MTLKNIIIDCKNLALYSSGISGFFKPFLLGLVESLQDIHFILVAPYEFDTVFISQYTNWEIRIVPYRNTSLGILNTILYDCYILPKALNRINAIALISPYYDFLIPHKFHNKSIITVHDLCFWELKALYSFKLRMYYKLLLKFNVYRAKKIITVSKTSLNQIIKFFGKKVGEKTHVIYNTFHQINFQSKIPRNEQQILLYTGGFDVRKNIDNLFKGISKIKHEHSFKLYFTGNTIRNQQLSNLITTYGLDDVIVLTGVLSTKEMAEYYQSCDGVVNVSFCEGFGRTNLEAVQYNKPLLCSNIPVFQELVGSYPIYCDPNDITSIATGLLKLLDKQTIDNSEVDFTRFNEENNIMTYINYIKAAINE